MCVGRSDRLPDYTDRRTISHVLQQRNHQQPQDVCKLPLFQRRALLQAVVKPKLHRLEIIDRREVRAASLEMEEKQRLQCLAEYVRSG